MRAPAARAAVLSVLVPVFNEHDFVLTTLARVLAAPAGGLRKEIVVVDDGSSDGTRELLTALQAAWPERLVDAARRLGLSLPAAIWDEAELRVIHHARNEGKGAAIRTAIDACTGDICVVQDADLEYDPADYGRLLQPILDGQADAVFGSRFLGEGSRRVLYFRHTLGNKFLTTVSNLLNDLNLTDMETGYKVVRTELLKTLNLVSNRFGFEPEVTAKLAKVGARIYEVSISYHGRTYAEGKKISWRDGLAALWHIVRFNCFPGVYCRDAGHETLRNLGTLRAFNQYMYETVAPFLGRRVVEVGAGIGNITSYLAHKRYVLATDLEAEYVRELTRRFRDRLNVDVQHWDVRKPLDVAMTPWTGDQQEEGDDSRNFDSVVCLNVLEHVADEDLALTHMRDCLRPDGRLIVLVPAHPSLFCPLDTEVGHFRRYSKGDLHTVLQSGGFEVERIVPFNVWGLFGWWCNGRILKRKRLPGSQLSLFGRLAWVLVWLEKTFRPPFGLSYIAVARRAEGVVSTSRGRVHGDVEEACHH